MYERGLSFYEDPSVRPHVGIAVTVAGFTMRYMELGMHGRGGRTISRNRCLRQFGENYNQNIAFQT